MNELNNLFVDDWISAFIEVLSKKLMDSLDTSNEEVSGDE